MSAREHIEYANGCLVPQSGPTDVLAVGLAEAQAHALLAIAEAILEATHGLPSPCQECPARRPR